MVRRIQLKIIYRKFILGDRVFPDKSFVFSISSQLLLLAGFGALIAAIVFTKDGTINLAFGLFAVSLTIFFMLSPFFAMIGNVILYSRTRKTKVAFIALAELAVLILIGLRCIPYLYASPALTSNRLGTYKAFIDLASNKDDLFESMSLERFGRVFVEDKYYDIRLDTRDLGEFFSDSEITRLSRLSRQFHKINCYRASWTQDWVIFKTHTSPYRPLFLGAIFSKNGRNPNDSDDIELKELGPFTLIDNNWYTSSKLHIDSETACLFPMPWQSLIDRREVTVDCPN